jgi:hypothetical protein
LTPKVNILSDEVKAKAAGDTDKGSVIAREPAGRIATFVAVIRSAGLDLAAAGNTQDATMNDIARQLRAQIPSSTDPDRLERMAREIEGAASAGRRRGQAHQGQADDDRSAAASAHRVNRHRP